MPPDVDALLAAARHAHEMGDLDRAIEAYQDALQARENDPKILYLLGNVLIEAKQAAAAVPHLQAAAARQRNHPAVLGSLAQAHLDLGQAAKAEAGFRAALRAEPGALYLQIGLASALALQKKFADAETLLKRVLSREPRAAYAWMNLGHVARDQARFEEACAHYREALRCDSALLDARVSLGSALHSLLRFKDAEAEYRACIAADPNFVLARSNLASVLIDVGRFAEAETQGRELVVSAPNFPDAHSMLGAAIAAQGRLNEALPHFRQAASLSPDTPRYRDAYASALCETGDVEQGLRLFGLALRSGGETQTATQMAYGVLLANGYFAEGWQCYRQRPTYARIVTHHAYLKLQQFLPAPLSGKHIGVICEQGLGDELFFLRFAAQVKAQGARITYCTSPKLETLLKRVAALDAIVTRPQDMPPTDANILVGDLAHALIEADASVPAPEAAADDGSLLSVFPWTHAPYAPLPPGSLAIAPLPEALAAIRAQLAQAGSPPYLAVTWRGGTAPEQQRGAEWKLFKEISIQQLAQALAAWPGTLLALQRLPAAGEIAALQAALGRPVVDFTAVNENLEHMLALLSLIDEYVGVSNTNVHLRAAAGRATRVLVPCPPEWRWMASGVSPWFPGSRIYRQTPDGLWDDALNALRVDLST